MQVEVNGEGPAPARILICGEAPGADEERLGHPFVGASGKELDKMLAEAGIQRAECYVTNVCKHRPPDNKIEAWLSNAKKKASIPQGYLPLRNLHVHPHIHEGFQKLLKEIELVQPNVIIAFGNVSLWALTGKWGISKWRGSHLRVDWDSNGPLVIPTWHPAYILRDWSERAAGVRDLRRAVHLQHSRSDKKPEWKFLIRPSFVDAITALNSLLARLDAGPLKLVNDLETRAGHIACSGIAWSKTEAICIPFMCVERASGYWTEEQEAHLICLHYKVLTHKNARVVNQNYLYDAQYELRWWLFVGNFFRDTMISHHVAFCELPKALDYQASLYCEHYVYWKDDSRNWDPKLGEDQLWIYNCEDCVRTWEVDEVVSKTVESLGLQAVSDFQHKLFWPTLRAMAIGLKRNNTSNAILNEELKTEAQIREQWLERVLGHPLNVQSPKQIQALFYEDFKQPIIRNRKTKTPTTNDEALKKISSREPLLKPVIKNIRELRSIGTFKSTFLGMGKKPKNILDWDGRVRTSLNPCGTYTFRISSSESAFWNGINMLNIPGKFKPEEIDSLELPNIRKLFIPDEGFTYFDMDLDRADLQVVVWEADDEDMKKMLRMGVDMHCAAAVDIWGIPSIPIEELVETHPNYKEHRGRITERKRHMAKGGVHATDYACKPPTFASQFGCTIREAEKFINGWFARHPGIKKWHERTLAKISGKRPFVDNIYGYRWYLFSRPDLPAALAWQPQSVVGRSINETWERIYRLAKYIQVLIQIYDSLVGQFPTRLKEQALQDLRTLAPTTIPYADPLIIPVNIKTSEVSWGECG